VITKDFKDLLRAFNANAVRYLIGSIDDEVTASVISREDLIRNKLASAREQDLLDVKVLRKAEQVIRRSNR
jgi:hypothetical protein